MKLLVISEQLISPFRFWLDGELQNGMRFQGELFRRFYVAESTNLESTYSLGVALRQERLQAIITYTGAEKTPSSCYTIWVNLRTLDHGRLALNPGEEFLQAAAQAIAS